MGKMDKKLLPVFMTTLKWRIRKWILGTTAKNGSLKDAGQCS